MKYFAKLILGESPYPELKGYELVSDTKEFNSNQEADEWFNGDYKVAILKSNLKGKTQLYSVIARQTIVISHLTM